MKHLVIFLCVIFFIPRIGSASDNPDATITNVEEFNYHGIDILLRDSKEAPVVTAILFIKGGTSILPFTEPASSEYFALNVIPGSGTEFTSKQRYRRVMMRMVSGIGAVEGRDYSVL